jgi:hypothetical protein
MGKRTTQLNEITTVDNNDILYGVDVDDLTHSPDGTSVKFKKSNLLKEVNSRVGDIESDVSELQGIISGLLDWFYPIGTIYETTSSELDTTTKMGNHFGGTWEAYGTGRVLVAKSSDTEFDTIGKTGGAKTHTLTVAETPSHSHRLKVDSNKGVVSETEGAGYLRADSADLGRLNSGLSNPLDGCADTTTSGSGQAHNNLQPYIVVFRYRRTA